MPISFVIALFYISSCKKSNNINNELKNSSSTQFSKNEFSKDILNKDDYLEGRRFVTSEEILHKIKEQTDEIFKKVNEKNINKKKAQDIERTQNRIINITNKVLQYFQNENRLVSETTLLNHFNIYKDNIKPKHVLEYEVIQRILNLIDNVIFNPDADTDTDSYPYRQDFSLVYGGYDDRFYGEVGLTIQNTANLVASNEENFATKLELFTKSLEVFTKVKEILEYLKYKNNLLNMDKIIYHFSKKNSQTNYEKIILTTLSQIVYTSGRDIDEQNILNSLMFGVDNKENIFYTTKWKSQK
jgi:hypothetical protein